MQVLTFAVIAVALAAGTPAEASACDSQATAAPTPPSAQGLYPLRILRVDSRVADPADRQGTFQGTRSNQGPIARQAFAAPPLDPMLQTRRAVRLEPGTHVLQVSEQIPASALSQVAARDRRSAGTPRPRTLTIDVQPGQEYALAARLVPETAHRTRANEHWEPVVWRQEARDCRS